MSEKLIDIPAQFLSEWIPNLPPASELSSALPAGNIWTRSASKAAMEFSQYAQASMTARLQGKGIALPPGVREASQSVFEIGFLFAGAKTKTEMIQAAIGAVENFNNIATTAGLFSDIPVVGWIVGGLIAAANIGVEIWQAKKTRADGKIPHVESLVYDESADEFWSRELLAMMEEDDWTEIFLPFTVGEPMSYKLIDPPPNYNRVWVIGEDQIGFGVCPARGLLRTWNFDTTDSINYLRNRNPIRGAYGWVRPMSVATAMQMWSRVQTKTEQAFRVRTAVVADGWSRWEEPLIPMAYQEGYKPEDTMLRARSIITPKTGGIDAPATYRDPMAKGAPTIAAFVRYQMDLLAQRQRALCDTVQCAYVPADAAALSDSGLKSHWKDRRKQLLGHSAVHAVDPAAVPEQAYRQAVIQAQKTVPFPLKGVPVGALPDADAPPPPTLPPNEFTPGLVIPPKKKQGQLGKIILPAAAAGAALYFLPKIWK